MGVLVTELSQSTLRELNEASDSTLGAIGNGAGADTVVNATTLYDYITQAQNEWCETAWPLPGTASLATWAAGVKTTLLHNLTVPSGQGRLWAVRGMAMGSTPTPLDRISLASLNAEKPLYEFDASGTPLYFFEEPSFVGVYPAPSTDRAASLTGLALPLPAGDGSGGTLPTLIFAPDDLLRRVIPVGAAILLAQKAFDDPSVFGRLDHLIARYVALRDRYRMGVSEELRQHLRMPEIVARSRR